MRVNELTTVVRTMEKITVIMANEKIRPNRSFLLSFIWIPHSSLIGIAMTKKLSANCRYEIEPATCSENQR